MRLTKERKIFAGIFGLALAALAVDRFIIGLPDVPAEAAAAAIEPGEPELLLAAPGKPDVVRLPATVPVAKQLDRLAAAIDPDANLDGFAAPAAWVRLLTPQPPPDADVATPDSSAVFEKVAAQWVNPAAGQPKRLSSLIAATRQRDGGAVINGHFIRIHDQIDGFTLLSTSDAGALFVDPTRTFTVELWLRDPGFKVVPTGAEVIAPSGRD